MSNIKKSYALVPVADKCDGIETSTIIGTLRNAGIIVDVASVENSLEVRLSENITILADCNIRDCKRFYDAVVIPGGYSGNITLRKSKFLEDLLEETYYWGVIGALSSAPALVLSHWECLRSPATVYPNEGYRRIIGNSVEIKNEDVVISTDKMQVTGTGQSGAIIFALAIVSLVQSEKNADKTAKRMLVLYEDEV